MDIYDDVDIHARLCFKREGIMQMTDLIASDIQHETDWNGTLLPGLQVCVAFHYFATKSMQNLVGDSIQFTNLQYVEWSATGTSINAQNTCHCRFPWCTWMHWWDTNQDKSTYGGWECICEWEGLSFIKHPSHLWPNFVFFWTLSLDGQIQSTTALS